MDLLILLLVMISGVLLYIRLNLKKSDYRYYDLLPRENGWPLVGILFQIQPTFHHYLMMLTKKHGELFIYKLGMRPILSINSYGMLKKCLRDYDEIFAGRWQGKLFQNTIRRSGIIFIDGVKWDKQRAFVIKVLRDLGMGKSKSFDIINQESDFLIETINGNSQNGNEIEFFETMSLHTINIISKFIMNKRFKLDNPDIICLKELISKIITNRDYIQHIMLMFPVLDDSDLFVHVIRKCTYWFSSFDKGHEFINREIKAHRIKLDYNSQGEDLIDAFLIEQRKSLDSKGDVEYFTDFQLIRTGFELFISGFETTSLTMTWGMFFLSKHQSIQEKMFEEISSVIGTEQLSDMSAKKLLPYTSAVMDEILRLVCPVPLGIFHRTLEDVLIDGHFIPRNTFVTPNFFAAHRDKLIWERPFDFYPEHFLQKDENNTWIYTPREELTTFGIGKRQCLGKSLGEIELFVFLVKIIQRYNVNFKDPISTAKYAQVNVGHDGAIRKCDITKFVFTRRH